MELKKTIDNVEFELVPIAYKKQLEEGLQRCKEISIIEAKLYNSLCTTMRLGKKLKEMIEGNNDK